MESVNAEKKSIPNQLRSEWRMLLIVIIVGFLINGCTDQKPRVYRVGVISGADLFLPVIDGLKSKMSELGFKEGKTIVYAIHAYNNDPEGERRAVDTLVAEKVDLIVTVPTQPSVKAHRAIQGTDIPLVFSYAGTERPSGFPGAPFPKSRETLLFTTASCWTSRNAKKPRNPCA
jgi:ABC-type uncharacterized transport system substrate-binding protein